MLGQATHSGDPDSRGYNPYGFRIPVCTGFYGKQIIQSVPMRLSVHILPAGSVPAIRMQNCVHLSLPIAVPDNRNGCTTAGNRCTFCQCPTYRRFKSALILRTCIFMFAQVQPALPLATPYPVLHVIRQAIRGNVASAPGN